MKTADWLLIVLSCYFHDLGMLVTKNEFEKRYDCPDFIAFKTEIMAGDNGKDYEEALEKLTSDEREEFLYQEFVRKEPCETNLLLDSGTGCASIWGGRRCRCGSQRSLGGPGTVVRDDLAKICLSHHKDDLFDFDKYR